MLGILLTFRAMFGMPALSFDGRFINVYVIPFYRIPLSQMDTRNNRDFGSALTGFVFDGLSVGI